MSPKSVLCAASTAGGLAEARTNEKLHWPVLGSGASSVEDCEAAYLEAGFTAGAGFAAGVVLVPLAGFLVECLCTVFAGFLVAAGALEVTAGAAGFAGVLCAGGFWAANIVVEATAKAIVSKVFFMAFFSPGEPRCSLALQLYGRSDRKIIR